MGIGARTNICLEYCQAWFEACKGDYFAYDTISGKIAPCRPDSLLCSPLEGMVPDGTGLCHELGLKAALSPSLDCYDGVAPEPLEGCLELPAFEEQAVNLWLLFRLMAPLACMALLVCGLWVLRRGRYTLRASRDSQQQHGVAREQAEHLAMLQKRIKKVAVH